MGPGRRWSGLVPGLGASLDRSLGGGADQGADHHALQAAHQVNLESEVGVLQGVVAGGVRPVLGEGGGGEEEGG